METKDKYKHHITYKPDVAKAMTLPEDQFMEYISLLIFIGDDARLWLKYGHARAYYDRLNKFYDLKTRKWVNK